MWCDERQMTLLFKDSATLCRPLNQWNLFELSSKLAVLQGSDEQLAESCWAEMIKKAQEIHSVGRNEHCK